MELFGMDAGLVCKGDFLPVIVFQFCGRIAAAQHPFFKFGIRSPDRLPVDVSVPLVVFRFIIPINIVDVVRSVKSAVGNNDGTGTGEFLFDPVQDGAHMDFFRFISREQVKGKGDPVPVHQKPHFHDRVRAVVFLRAAFPVSGIYRASFFVNGTAVIIKEIHVGPSDIEIIIRAVKVRNGKVPSTDPAGTVKYPFLEGFPVI